MSENPEKYVDDDPNHPLIGTKMVGNIVTKVIETIVPYSDRFYKIKRAITLDNGMLLNQDEYVKKEDEEERIERLKREKAREEKAKAQAAAAAKKAKEEAAAEKLRKKKQLEEVKAAAKTVKKIRETENQQEVVEQKRLEDAGGTSPRKRPSSTSKLSLHEGIQNELSLDVNDVPASPKKPNSTSKLMETKSKSPRPGGGATTKPKIKNRLSLHLPTSPRGTNRRFKSATSGSDTQSLNSGRASHSSLPFMDGSDHLGGSTTSLDMVDTGDVLYRKARDSLVSPTPAPKRSASAGDGRRRGRSGNGSMTRRMQRPSAVGGALPFGDNDEMSEISIEDILLAQEERKKLLEEKDKLQQSWKEFEDEKAENQRKWERERARLEEEQRKMLHRERAKLEEERRRLEEERKRREEERMKYEEERKKLDDLEKQRQLSIEEKQRKLELEEKARLDEERVRQEQEKLRKDVEEEQAKRQQSVEKALSSLDQEKARLEAERKKMEEERQQFEEEKQRLLEEERRKIEEEARAQLEEEKRKLVEQQQHNETLVPIKGGDDEGGKRKSRKSGSKSSGKSKSKDKKGSSGGGDDAKSKSSKKSDKKKSKKGDSSKKSGKKKSSNQTTSDGDRLEPIKSPKSSKSKRKATKPTSDEGAKKKTQTFDKIMNVLGTRETKSYATPLETVRRGTDLPKPILTKEDWAKRWEEKGSSDRDVPLEAPRAKLQNVFGETLPDNPDFVAPVFKKSEAEKKMIAKSFEKDFVFNDLAPEAVGTLVDAFERIEYEQGATIANQGEPDSYYSIVQAGEVSFHADGQKIGSAGPGETFGELALLYSRPRGVDVRVGDHQTVLFQINQSNFRQVMREQMHRSEEEKTKLLRSVPMFKDVDESDLKQLSAAMVPINFKKGENLSNTFRDAPFCLVQQGSVVATDATIGPGQSYGGNSMKKHKEANKFEVAAESDGVVFTIDRESFDKVFGDFDRLSNKFRDKETLAGIKAVKAQNLNDDQMDTLARQITETSYEEGHVIFLRDDRMVPALYLVRKGTVQIIKKNGKEETIGPGGYFAQEYLTFVANKEVGTTIPKFAIAKYSAAAIEDTECGVLTLQDLATVSGLLNSLPSMPTLEHETSVQLDDLTRHRILGEGQFGTVWLVTSRKDTTPEPYALKIQYTDDGERNDAAACIRREIKMMEALQHNFIVKLVNSYEEDAQISMLLSLAPGGELFDIIHHQDETGGWVSGLGEEKARFYAPIVADTIAFMHRQKYVYRDLKPENILIDKDGYPLITDFGFVKKVEDKTYTFCGTPNYVAPEVVLNRGHGVSADNWSLGVLIYELVDGENPFWTEGMDQETLYELIIKGLYYPLPETDSPELRDVVSRLLEKEPSQRMGTFREKDILEHPWFSKYDIRKLREKQIRAPWVPEPISYHEEKGE